MIFFFILAGRDLFTKDSKEKGALLRYLLALIHTGSLSGLKDWIKNGPFIQFYLATPGMDRLLLSS